MSRFSRTAKLLTLSLLCVLFAIPLMAGSKADVQYIAIHFGNPDYVQALDKSNFPGFSFYTSTDEVYQYVEKQKLMGNFTNLRGYYGKLPESMGFGPNSTPDRKGIPNANGSFMVVDAAGTIYYQLPANARGGDSHFAGAKSATKKVGKGKKAKALKAKKCKYRKSTPVGDIQPTKGSKIDKKLEGLVGWKLPDAQLLDDNGQAVALADITRGKNTVIVFYTMDAVHMKRGDTKGNIIEEWDNETLTSLQTGDDIQNTVMSGDTPTNAASFLLKTAVAGTAARNSNDKQIEVLTLLNMAKGIKKELKH